MSDHASDIPSLEISEADFSRLFSGAQTLVRTLATARETSPQAYEGPIDQPSQEPASVLFANEQGYLDDEFERARPNDRPYNRNRGSVHPDWLISALDEQFKAQMPGIALPAPRESGHDYTDNLARPNLAKPEPSTEAKIAENRYKPTEQSLAAAQHMINVANLSARRRLESILAYERFGLRKLQPRQVAFHHSTVAARLKTI